MSHRAHLVTMIIIVSLTYIQNEMLPSAVCVVFVSIPVRRSFNYIVDVKFITYSLFFGKQCIFSSGALKVLILPASAVFL